MTENLLSFDEYQLLCARTMKEDPFPMKVLHCACGMSGEAGELKELFSYQEGRIGEIGDCMWYSAVLASLMGWSMDEINREAIILNDAPLAEFNHRSGEDRAVIWSGRFLEKAKKLVFYDRQLDQESVRHMLSNYWAALLSLCAKESVGPLFVALSNVRKLEARYPGNVFSSANANVRSTESESAAAGVTII